MRIPLAALKWMIPVVCVAGAGAALAYVPKRQIAVTLKALPKAESYGLEARLPVTLLLTNGLSGEIGFERFAAKPNSWNGETYGCSVVEIYRDGRPTNLYLARPRLTVPLTVSGPALKYVKPGESLEIELDVRKWRIRDGWRRGTYRAVFRVDRIIADEYVRLSVLSEPVTFEVR
ncbi:MAG: hypothetical protein JSV65_04525 [Armatimonadota bacterium]|nr:MAG: hypothetical protein JSV65_04525 [Armatimonadota bacterium]